MLRTKLRGDRLRSIENLYFLRNLHSENIIQKLTHTPFSKFKDADCRIAYLMCWNNFEYYCYYLFLYKMVYMCSSLLQLAPESRLYSLQENNCCSVQDHSECISVNLISFTVWNTFGIAVTVCKYQCIWQFLKKIEEKWIYLIDRNFHMTCWLVWIWPSKSPSHSLIFCEM